MLDLHVHDAHFIRLVFGMPQEVTTTGRLRDGLPEFWHTQFRFADPNLIVEATSGTIDQSAFDAIKGAGYTDEQLVEISLAIATTTFTNIFNRINDTDVDFPAVK